MPVSRAAAPKPVPTEITPISTIQGAGQRSSFTGEQRRTEGVVVGSKITTFAHDRKVQTIYIQDPTGDGDARTSDGMAIRVSPPIGDVQLGQRLVATGEVSEKYKMTALENAKVELGELGTPLAPKTIQLPSDAGLSAALLESHEGMRVAFPKGVVMGGIDSFGNFAVVDPQHGPHKNFDKVGSGSHFVVASGENSRWKLGTGDTVANIEGPLEHTGNGYQTLLDSQMERTGDGPAVPKLWGDVDGNGTIDPSDLEAIGARAGSAAAHQLDPADMDGDGAISAKDLKLATDRAARMASTAPSFTVATMNAENFFDTVDTPNKAGKLKGDAISPAEFDAKVASVSDIVANTLQAPTLLGLQEVENETVLDALVNSPALKQYGYRYAILPGTDTRGINSALLYRGDQGVTVDNVRQVNEQARRGKYGWDPKGEKLVDVFRRPPLVADVTIPGVDGTADERLTVMVNHFMSAYAPSGFSTEDWRIKQAEVVRKAATQLQKAHPDRNVLMMGDLNANETSIPLSVLGSASSKLRNLSAKFVPQGERYTYVYRGSSEQLDHMFATKEFMDRVNHARIHHLNADYPNSDARATDHDLLSARIEFAPKSAKK